MPTEFKVKLSPKAERDFELALLYYHERSPQTAIRFAQCFDSTLKSLRLFWKYQIKYAHIRCKRINGFPYVLHYSVNETQYHIEADALYYEKQNAPY